MKEKKPYFIHTKVYYFITELFVGIALMGVEMSASRLISTYFSSSQVVWTLIIGVIMIAMAIGNYWGGRQADKKPSYTRLYLELLFAGAYIALIPFFGRFVIAGVSALFALIVTSNLVIWASLVSCLILFVPPLLFLGKVTPSLVKYSMGEKVSGKVIGSLEALNTIGSIVGTFLPTFLTIPFIGTSNSFVLFGSMISALGLIYIITELIEKNSKRKISNDENLEENVKIKKYEFKVTILSAVYSALLIIGIVLSSNASFIFWNDETLIKEDESIYNYLKVDKIGNQYSFSTNVLFGIQSAINEDDSLTDMYYDYLLVSPFLVKENPNILILGNGTGTYATLMKNYLQVECEITAVEIDQKIIDLSYEYFHMSDDINVVCDDGRNYLTRSKDKYDIVLVDAYSSISAPFQMTTVEFFTLVKNHLNDDGIMMMNINMVSEAKDSINVALCDTAYSVFDNLYTFKVPNGSGMEVFSSKNNDVNLLERIQNIDASDYEYALELKFNQMKRGLKEYKDTGIRLYDDTCDVEIRSIRALDNIINAELEYYRRIFKEKGIRGLMEELFRS
ncbi:MAG: fused MFS/spermidine synthase [Erysipelotrichales bacterium]|nr:fused MFS/spermidine synthase [Erysipelotrichales bacterium]